MLGAAKKLHNYADVSYAVWRDSLFAAQLTPLRLRDAFR